jgi:hypothetical protein
MESWSLYLIITLTVAALLVLLVDVGQRARASWLRRRGAQGGVWCVVVDIRGHILGVYVDPTGEPQRSSRVHEPGSPWTNGDPTDADGWAWEGRAETEAEATHLANRLRALHTRLLPELRMQLEWSDEEESPGLWPGA